jgi:hypothetical protein
MRRQHQATDKRHRRGRNTPHQSPREEMAMSQFYEDNQAFGRQLRARAAGPRCCWSCSTESPLVNFNVHKDFVTLGLLADGCRESVGLCLACSVAYMNSFNDALAQKRGGKRRSSHWTLERFLRFLRGGMAADLAG